MQAQAEFNWKKRKTLQEMHEEAFGKKKKKEHRDVFDLHDEHDDDDADCCID